MPLDSTGYQQPATPQPRRRSTLTKDVGFVVLFLLLVGLMIVPVSLAGLVDLVTYLRAR